MYIGNFPQELRVSRKKKGGAVLLGYIPEVHVMFFRCADGLTSICRSSGDRQTWMQLLLIIARESTMLPC